MDDYGRRALWAAVCLKACDDYITAYHDNDEKTLIECVEFFKSPIFYKLTGVYAPEAVRILKKLPKGTITHVWRKTREKRKYDPTTRIRKHNNRPRAYTEVRSWRTNEEDGSYASKTVSQKIQRLL